jgi:hypothetical protein
LKGGIFRHDPHFSCQRYPLMRTCIFVTVALATSLTGDIALAETLQVPEGGKAISFGKQRVLCGASPEGWTVSADRQSVRPPDAANDTNRTVDVLVATDGLACAREKSTLTLIAVGQWPDIDPASVTFFPDEGRLEFKGTHLEQSQILWQLADQNGEESCLVPLSDGRLQHCTIPLNHKLPINTMLRWLPANAKDGPDVTTFDSQGQSVDISKLKLRPARTVVEKIFAETESLDVSQGIGILPLAHPEAVASVDCGLIRCELSEGGILVRSVLAQATNMTVTAHLSPRFAIGRGDRIENSATGNFALLRCPLTVVSGPPLRDADEPQILVKMAARCRSTAKLRWSVGTEPAEVVRDLHTDDGDYILLRTGQLAGGSVTISAARADSVAGVVGSVTTPTAPAPRPQSTLELPGHGPIDFIPTNRDALWSVGGVPHARFLPLELPGAYTLRTEKNLNHVRGDHNSAGFVNLRYAYRRDDLPKGFSDVNLALLSETVQRPLREASVPVPFGATATRKEPIAEFICADAKGNVHALASGKPARISYSARETCRVVIHQERVSPEDGQQQIVLEIEVTKASGGKRSDASVNEHIVLRPGGEPRTFFLKGITEQFDQITVRLSHIVDETRYVLDTRGKQEPPSEQWSATIEGGHVRLYVSLNVPAGLYRINEPSASMTLNFGVLGRLTWLDRQGKEGLLGLETGVLGASLIPQQYNNSPAFPATLVTLLGFGLRVEVGQGAAVGVHLWGAYEFRSTYQYTNSSGDSRAATHWSLLFGPSISIGNIGTNL